MAIRDPKDWTQEDLVIKIELLRKCKFVVSDEYIAEVMQQEIEYLTNFLDEKSMKLLYPKDYEDLEQV